MSPGPASPGRCDSPQAFVAEVSVADMGWSAGSSSPSAAGTAGSRGRQQEADDGQPQLQLRVEPERGAAGLPSSRFYGRLGVRGSTDKERWLAPTGFL
jgi:hypothetical protein